MCGGNDAKKRQREAERRARREAARAAEEMRRQQEENNRRLEQMRQQAAKQQRAQELATANQLKNRDFKTGAAEGTVQMAKPKKRATRRRLRIPLANTGLAGGASGQNTP